MLRLFDFYKNKILLKLKKQFNYKSVMQVPKIIKITLNIGVGKAVINKKILDKAILDLMLISGQKPIITKVRKSIALFKIRQGNSIGCKVTLRNIRMWDFLERLIFIAIPRIRDFRGLSIKSFDGFGNYNFGIKEHIIFPEIDFNVVNFSFGLDVSITTSAKSDYECKVLLSSLNFPFSNNFR